MIVKNEEHCIERCLKSARPFIDYCVISDTGSSDNTLSKIKNSFEILNLSGEVYSDEWVDFSHNRNLCLKRCFGKSDYVLFMDADEIINDIKNELPLKDDCDFDAYSGLSCLPTFEYEKVRIYKNDGNWEWKSPIHEYLHCNKTNIKTKKTSILFTDLGDGNRNISGTKFYKDVIILEREYRKDPFDGRIIFYLGQTYEHMGSLEKAYETYKRRANLGSWDEEVYYSLYRMAEIHYKLNSLDILKSIDHFLIAATNRPQRLESLLSACEKLREKHLWGIIYNLTQNKKGIKNDDILFVNRNSEWRIVDEHALAAYYLGRKEEAKDDFQYILNNYDIDYNDKVRIISNIALC